MKISEFDGLDEANVGAEFYHYCRMNGLECYLEVPAFSAVHRSRRFRIDCIVAVDGEAICAIEFKAAGAEPQLFRESRAGGSRQSTAYDALGIPWAYCIGKEQVPDAIEWVLSIKQHRLKGAA